MVTDSDKNMTRETIIIICTTMKKMKSNICEFLKRVFKSHEIYYCILIQLQSVIITHVIIFDCFSL